MSIERRSETTTSDHAGEKLPWLLPESGVHITTFVASDVARALGLQDWVADKLVVEHPSAVTSYDSDTVAGGCGCGWHGPYHPLNLTGRTEAASDLSGHLHEASGRIEFSGTSE